MFGLDGGGGGEGTFGPRRALTAWRRGPTEPVTSVSAIRDCTHNHQPSGLGCVGPEVAEVGCPDVCSSRPVIAFSRLEVSGSGAPESARGFPFEKEPV